MKLVSSRSREKQSAHVDREKVAAVTASNCDCLEQTTTRNANLPFMHKTSTIQIPHTHKINNNNIRLNGREKESSAPRGQCRKNCNGRNRAGRKERGGGPVKRQRMRRTSYFCGLSLSLSVCVCVSE